MREETGKGTGISIDVIDDIRGIAEELARSFAESRTHCRYADIRVEAGESRGGYAEDGKPKGGWEDYNFSAGIRVIAEDGSRAPGYWGRVLGASDLPRMEDILAAGLSTALARARANGREKARVRDRLGPLGRSLWDTELAPVEICRDTVVEPYEIDPRSIDCGEVTRYCREISAEIHALDPAIKFNYLLAFTGLFRELFVSSEGASVDQTFPITQALPFVVGVGEKAKQDHFRDFGEQAGWEAAVHGKNCYGKDLRAFALDLARDVLELLEAPPLPSTDRDVVVVTDPSYNALLVHEIVGHPTEADRALKCETAYAGRSWFYAGLQENQVGRRVASEQVTAFSDPLLPGFGHYRYDHEGTPAKRVVHIERGIFRGFMNSRQTAAIMGTEPNGSYLATDAMYVPLIRMSNTVFAPGDRDPRDILSEVEHGYYLVGERIPSIAESRENFRITAIKTYEIRNGKPGRLYRDGGITSDSRDFLMNVDAVGNDFTIFPIPNCGKGQPMQSKRVGNGSPTLRSRARLTGS
jgi:TldD protein